jgi:Fur family transcriptional regulator, ferric uptake regulator
MTPDSDLFHNNGLRLTKQRKLLLQNLTDIPLSAEEIFRKLKLNHAAIDQATVYRSLDCLVKLGLVGKIQFGDNVSKFELLDSHHHHHLVCEKCGVVEDIPLNDEKMFKNIGKKTKFKIIRHSLEFFGICYECQKLI